MLHQVKLVLILLLLSSFGYGQSHGYALQFQSVGNTNASHYEIYVWSGAVIGDAPFNDVDSTHITPHTGLLKATVNHMGENEMVVTFFQAPADGVSFIQVGVLAVLDTGIKSRTWAASNVIQAVDRTVPDIIYPDIITIINISQLPQ